VDGLKIQFYTIDLHTFSRGYVVRDILWYWIHRFIGSLLSMRIRRTLKHLSQSTHDSMLALAIALSTALNWSSNSAPHDLWYLSHAVAYTRNITSTSPLSSIIECMVFAFSRVLGLPKWSDYFSGTHSWSELFHPWVYSRVAAFELPATVRIHSSACRWFLTDFW